MLLETLDPKHTGKVLERVLDLYNVSNALGQYRSSSYAANGAVEDKVAGGKAGGAVLLHLQTRVRQTANLGTA